MKKLTILINSFIFTFIFTATAFASGGEGGHFDFWQFAAGIINFAIFIYLIVRFAGPSLKNFYKTRAEDQLLAVREAEALIKEARCLFEETKTRKDNLEAETQKMIGDARKLADKQAKEVLDAARACAVRMMEDAKRSIELEADQTIERLKAELVETAISVAEKSVKDKLKAKEQMQLVKQFMTKMEDLQQ